MAIGGINRQALRNALSQLPPEMVAYAEQMAARARSAAPKVQDRDGGPREIELPIKVEATEGTFGARVAVVIAHPAGLNVEAKHALLARSI